MTNQPFKGIVKPFGLLTLLTLLTAWGLAGALPAEAAFFFSTGSPDGLIATASRPDSPGKQEIESADDFVIATPTAISSATFTGLIPTGVPLSGVQEVIAEIYRVFPKDSTNPPSGNVPTRANSPSDVAFASLDSATGGLTFSTSLLDTSFTAANSVLNGINPLPNQFTGGEGPVTGQEVLFSLNFATPIDLPADHYFFVPQVLLSSGDFLWLSAPKPISAGTPFTPDLQSWIRDGDLDPDWLRIGTDITHQGPFNAAFSLSGQPVPEPASLLLMAAGLTCLLALRRR